jgi:hypothetical protein
MKKLLFVLALVAVLFGFLVVVKQKAMAPSELPDLNENQLQDAARMTFERFATDQGITDLSVKPNQELDGSVEITGKAQGYMFEGSFPVTIKTPDNNVVAMMPARAVGEWMTEKPVQFVFEVDFSMLPEGQLSIVLDQDDPSDGESGRVPKSLEIPVINVSQK